MKINKIAQKFPLCTLHLYSYTVMGNMYMEKEEKKYMNVSNMEEENEENISVISEVFISKKSSNQN